MTSIEKKAILLVIKAECSIRNVCQEISKKVKESTADGYMETLINILIAVVLGVALLAALKVFILDKFFPELEQQIMDMFTGGSSGGVTGSGGSNPGTGT